jgi:AraC-like DNA-binding protein
MQNSATLTSRALLGVEASLKAKGLVLADLADQVGIDVSATADPDALISFDAFAQLFELAARLSGDDAFGLKHGANMPHGALGIYHFIVVSADTIRDALTASTRFVRLTNSAYSITLDESDGSGAYIWHYPEPAAKYTQYSNAIAALLADRIRYMTEPAWMPLAVEFAHEKPRSMAAFERILGPNVTFAAPMARMRIDRATLDRPSGTKNHDLSRSLQPLAERILGLHSCRSGLVERTADQIVRAQAKGAVSEPAIAKSLGTSVRDLQRELAAAGTSFSALREEVRIDTAKRLLEQTDLQLTEISYLLGFSELSAFSRAAKNWFGVSPNVYRQQSRARTIDRLA